MMTEREQCIEQLKEFNKLLYEWEYGNVNGDVRSKINRKIISVQNIVLQTGTLRRYSIAPPPAIGGVVLKGINPFSCLFDPPYEQSLIQLVIDNIEVAIGVIESDPNFTMTSKQSKSIKSTNKSKESSNKVFIVHGKDELLKETTARFLEKLELQPIILHEQANKGQTIIEKFEEYSDVSFAVVLMSPDDVGRINNSDSVLYARARQNVVFELGYFIGKLGRGHVAALVKGDIEIPSDYSGMVFTGIDPSGAWQMTLAKEIKASGIDLDLNKIM